MSKIDIDSTSLNSNCTLKLNDTISSIEKCLNYCSQFSVPYGFPRKNDLENAISCMKETKNNLKQVSNWVSSSCTNYDSLISNLEIQAGKLSTDQIKKRDNIV